MYEVKNPHALRNLLIELMCKADQYSRNARLAILKGAILRANPTKTLAFQMLGHSLLTAVYLTKLVVRSGSNTASSYFD